MGGWSHPLMGSCLSIGGGCRACSRDNRAPGQTWRLSGSRFEGSHHTRLSPLLACGGLQEDVHLDLPPATNLALGWWASGSWERSLSALISLFFLCLILNMILARQRLPLIIGQKVVIYFWSLIPQAFLLPLYSRQSLWWQGLQGCRLCLLL